MYIADSKIIALFMSDQKQLLKIVPPVGNNYGLCVFSVRFTILRTGKPAPAPSTVYCRFRIITSMNKAGTFRAYPHLCQCIRHQRFPGFLSHLALFFKNQRSFCCHVNHKPKRSLLPMPPEHSKGISQLQPKQESLRVMGLALRCY